jgi:hypothetical protein
MLRVGHRRPVQHGGMLGPLLSFSRFLCLPPSQYRPLLPNQEKKRHRRPVDNCLLCVATCYSSEPPVSQWQQQKSQHPAYCRFHLLLSPLQESPPELSLMTTKRFCSQFGHEAPRGQSHVLLPLLCLLKKLVLVFLIRIIPRRLTTIFRQMRPGSALKDTCFSVFTTSHRLIPSHDSRHAFLSALPLF